MNIIEWHQAFKVQLDTLDNQSNLRLQPEVVDVFLNKAINKIMIELYDSYEESQEISDAMSSQTIIANCTFTSTGTNQWKVNLPSNYYHHLQSYARLKERAVTQRTGIVRTVKQLLDSENKVISNPFERADDTEVPIFFKDGGIYVYTPPDYDLDTFNITYLKNPKQVSYKQYIATNTPPVTPPNDTWTSDIDEYLHERIINLAVIYALETYGSERTPSKVQIKDVN
jgi:hypothetical protein